MIFTSKYFNKRRTDSEDDGARLTEGHMKGVLARAFGSYASMALTGVLVLMFCIVVPLCTFSQSASEGTTGRLNKPNVLFIAVDDLRPELGCYGAKYIHSPNIDRLASGGAVFTNHFTAVPTCGASRFAMLTGLLPRTRAQLSNEAIRTSISEKAEAETPETFIHHLRRNGYYTVGIGKISHYADGLLYGYSDPPTAKRELPHSWDELVFDAEKWGTGWNAFFGYSDGSNRQSRNKQVKPYEKADVNDNGYPDGLTANLAIRKLKELRQENRPFFLGVGFFKPHLPLNAPARYWDLYKEAEIGLTPSPGVPKSVNNASLTASGEFNGYLAGDEHPSLQAPASEAYQRKMRHAYFASISYVDAQIGKVLDELDGLGLADNTIVVLWSDHGWHLGDHRVWGKHTLFEVALRSPLIIRMPGTIEPGTRVARIVSSVNIYPTLMELCGVKMNSMTDGRSMVSLVKDPETDNWRDAAWSYYNKGVSLRTPRYRLTKYYRDKLPVIELFDHQTDPWENANVAAKNPEMIRELLPLLNEKDFDLYSTSK